MLGIVLYQFLLSSNWYNTDDWNNNEGTFAEVKYEK